MKEKINDFLKGAVLLFTMTMGFFFVYAYVWFAVGLPKTNWALLLCLAIAFATDYGYYRWLRDT